MTDPDRPELDGMELVVPFVVCQSQDGPYDDESFVAGFQAGEIDRGLWVMATLGADRFTTTVRTALVKQLELIAMHRGFPYVDADAIGETDDHPAMPEWSTITFSRAQQ